MLSTPIWLVYKQWNWVGFSSAQQVFFQGKCRVLIRPWILFANPRVTNRIQSNPMRSSPISLLQYGAWKAQWRPDMATSATSVTKTKTSFPSWLTVEGLAARCSGQNWATKRQKIHKTFPNVAKVREENAWLPSQGRKGNCGEGACG